ncbi:hypothetical protein [Amycolatopsis sp. NPDC098790]|uniref:hypothetical protein n=1 Tax=Amycolatopsis sp. NPDC098790 TaxID=3363939 RepID=UPI003824AD4C
MTGSADRADDIVALSRLATGPGAVGALLDWLATRTGGAAALLDVGGKPLALPCVTVVRLVGERVVDYRVHMDIAPAVG